MRGFIAKSIGYPLHDKVNGTNILNTIRFLNESQYWDDTRIYEYRLKKLKFLIEYARKNVPYYERIFGNLKLTSNDIRTLDDIYKIPLLTKEIFRVENHNLITRNLPKRNIKIGKTGGTTGSPVIVYKDTFNRSFTWASYYRWYEWMGLNYYDSVISFWGAPTVLNTSMKRKLLQKSINYIQNDLLINSFNVSSEMFPSVFEDIIDRKPKLIKGYLSSLLEFAKFIEKNNLEIPSLIALSSTTETLLKQHRIYLQNIFKSPIYDQYGCGEVSAISYECKMHNGLHINQEHVLIEILDDFGNPIFGKKGRVIGTDLDNLVMPFIRFENGDISTLSETKCSCGVNQPLMKSIEGRQIDTIVLDNGIKVHGVFFTDILFELEIDTRLVQRFQLIQYQIGSIEFRIEVELPLQAEVKARLQSALSRFISSVKIIEVSKIDTEPNGKFKYVKSYIT